MVSGEHSANGRFGCISRTHRTRTSYLDSHPRQTSRTTAKALVKPTPSTSS